MYKIVKMTKAHIIKLLKLKFKMIKYKNES